MEQTKRIKTKTPLNEKLPFILAFFIPVIIMVGIFAGKEIYPFGDNSFLRTDMYHQYAPFFAELQRKLTGGGSLAYSWNIGLGTNFISLLGYYLSCPLNFLLILCPKGFIIEFMTYLIVIKIGLSGLTFAYYLSCHNKTKDLGITFFAVFYALSGYMAAYSWNIMWLDCILLAPLIILGLERLVYENKFMLYTVTLGMAILSNYYIAIMLCLFMVLYFIVCMINLPACTYKRQRDDDGNEIRVQVRTNYLRPILNFGIFSLIAGALAACILLPEIFALKMTASADSTFPTDWKSYFSVFDMLSRHLVNVEVEIGLEHWPNIYCGVFVFMALPFYIMNKNVPYKEKITKLALLFFLLFCFATNVPNFIWHGFHYPNSLPCRQSFLYIAVLLAICYEGCRDIRTYSAKSLVGCFWGAAILILLMEKIIDAPELSFHVYYVSLIFLGLYALCLYLYRRMKITRITLLSILFVIVIIESALNTAVTSVTTTSRSGYLRYTEEYQELAASAREKDDTFYRIEKLSLKTKNDGAWVGYQSASTFSSTANANLSDFYKKMGMESSTNAYSFTGGTPLMGALLGVKYTLTTEALPDSSLYTLSATAGEAYLYENLSALPLGFMVPLELDNTWNTGLGNPAVIQNDFVSRAAGSGEVLESVDSSANGDTLEATLEEGGHIFAYITNRSVKDVDAAMGGRSKSFSHVDRGFLLDLGVCEAGDLISLTAGDDVSISGSLYRVVNDNLIEAANKLKEQPLEVLSYSDTKVDATISVKESGLLFTSIPYDKGWTLYVDGAKTPISVFADTFISVPLSAGEHTVKLTYQPEGLGLGLLITVNAAILLILIYIVSRYLAKKRGNGGTPEDSAAMEPGTDGWLSTDTANLGLNGTLDDTGFPSAMDTGELMEAMDALQHADGYAAHPESGSPGSGILESGSSASAEPGLDDPKTAAQESEVKTAQPESDSAGSVTRGSAAHNQDNRKKADASLQTDGINATAAVNTADVINTTASVNAPDTLNITASVNITAAVSTSGKTAADSASGKTTVNTAGKTDADNTVKAGEPSRPSLAQTDPLLANRTLRKHGKATKQKSARKGE